MQLKDHPKLRGIWPPEPGGAFGAGHQFPLTGEDTLDAVLYFAPVHSSKANIVLKTKDGNRAHTRDLIIEDSDFAERLASFLKTQIGKKIAEIANSSVSF
jgi:hypothetical protein